MTGPYELLGHPMTYLVTQIEKFQIGKEKFQIRNNVSVIMPHTITCYLSVRFIVRGLTAHKLIVVHLYTIFTENNYSNSREVNFYFRKKA